MSTITEAAQSLLVSIPRDKAKLCENCHVFFNCMDSRNGNCPFCQSEATEFYQNYIKRLTAASAAAREQAV